MLPISMDHRGLNETTHVDVLSCCIRYQLFIYVHNLSVNTVRDPPSMLVTVVVIVYCCKRVLYSSLI